MRLVCFHCGKAVSTEVPDDTVVRAALECPECIEKQPDYERLFAAYRADVEPVLRDSIALHDDYLEAPNVHPRNGGG